MNSSSSDSNAPRPSARQLAWHAREQYGFVHFTVNTFTNTEWGYGDEAPAVFNPSDLDCDQWVSAAKAGGLAALILTAKHHDGFCLWPTATTRHNIGASPFREGAGDVVKELSDACRRGGIGFGVYCSPWDRNHPAYGSEEYVDVYHAQWEELLTGYGELCELWLDGANGGDGYYGGARERRSIDSSRYYRFPELFSMMRRHQPDAVIFSDMGPDVRWCGNERGFTGITSWSKVDATCDGIGDAADRAQLISGSPDGDTWRPVEVDVSMRPGWFFHPTERSRSGDELFAIWLNSVGRGACLNLNLAPDTRGRIANEDVLALRSLRHRIESFTAIDLARGAALTIREPGTEVESVTSVLTDGDPGTCWTAGSTTPEIIVNLGSDERIAGIRIDEAIEFAQRIESFAIDVGKGGGWFEWYRGGTVGARAIVELSGAVASEVRIRLTGRQAPPVLSRVSVYSAGQSL